LKLYKPEFETLKPKFKILKQNLKFYKSEFETLKQKLKILKKIET